MKKLINALPVTAIIASLAFITILSSCKKDKDDDQPEQKSYRLTKVTSSEDGDNYVATISYNADNKITNILETENGVEVYKNTWVWNGSEVTVKESFLIDGTWIEDDYYSVMTYANNKVIKNEVHLNDSVSAISLYTWNGDMLTKEEAEIQSNNTTVLAYEINYLYENNLLKSAEYFSEGTMVQKQVIEYANGKPSAVKLFDDTNTLIESAQLNYTGDNITEILNFNVAEGVQGNVECTENRTYDANNCVSTASTSCVQGDNYSQQTTFEEGKGNFNDFLLTQISWVSVYLFPDSFPSQLAFKKK